MLVDLKRRRSEASSFLEFLGLLASFRGDGGDAIGSLAPSETEIRRLVELAREIPRQDLASVAGFRKLAGKLCFAQTATMGRFGRTALKPICELVLKQGGGSPRFPSKILD